jgi:hypothetical protein
LGFLTQKHMLTEHHSWRGSRNDGSACMPPTRYTISLQNISRCAMLTMAPRYHQSTNATFPPSTSARSKEAGIH